MNYIGIDVSKAKLDCLWLRDIENRKVKTKVLPNTPQGHQQLVGWLEKMASTIFDEIHITMEATGVYHEALALTLHTAGFIVSVVNPARSKEFARSLGTQHKTDKKDSFVLALYGAKVQPTAWQPEALEIRELKALLARLEALESDLLREQNRLEKSTVSSSSKLVLESLHKMIHELENEKKRLEREIDDHIDRHPHLKQDRALLESIPAVGKVLSRVMLSVIRSRDFSSASQVAAYLGLIPVQQESGVFKGRSRLSKTGPARVRSKLYMAAIVAWKWNDDCRRHKERLLSNGKTKMQALCATMRKLVHICFGVLKNQMEYQPQVA